MASTSKPSFAWHARGVDECMATAKSLDADNGLSSAEAERRLAESGPNALAPPERPSFLSKVWDQVNSALIWILLAAAAISGFQRDFVECGLILLVVTINVSIGIIQEGKAEEAANALSNMLAPHCVVVRDGSRKTIDACQLVVGDVVFMQSGDKVPADVRLVSCTNLQVLESMLTGESLAVTKTTAPAAEGAGIGDRKCMAFSATLVQQGQGTGLVVATGDFTAIGSINALVQGEADKASSLQLQLDVFGRVVTGCTAALGVAAFLLAVFYAGSTWAEAFRASVAIAVAVIPEGLPAVVTITMALGVNEMAARKAIVRKLPAVETLGSVSTVCSDKTGTLTKNEMTAVALVTGTAAEYAVSGVGYDPAAGSVLDAEGAPVDSATAGRLRTLLVSAVLPNDGGLSRSAGGEWEISGDPTDIAPLVLFTKLGGAHADVQRAADKVGVVPFESLHKWQAVLVRDATALAGRSAHFKGAPERLFPLCANAVAREDASLPPVAFDAEAWTAKAAELSGKGLRVLAIARWAPPADFDAAEFSVAWAAAQPTPFLTLVGLIAILDPPRAESIAAIREFHAAGIVVKMITGDHPKTALAIGAALGIAAPDGETLTGPQVDALSDGELGARVLTCNVFARASPENKIRIVKALQAHGQIVSMTGDGVNDAPSLKAANIGVAMGITGTDVSKEAAKIVLADDNFATIVHAVREGRRVWDNLRKLFLYNLAANFAQGLVVFFAFVLGLDKTPLTPIQVLYVNMIISVTLGGALSFEQAEDGVMKRRPRPSSEPLVSSHVVFRTAWVTTAMVASIIGIFRWALAQGAPIGEARAVAFSLLVATCVIYGLNCRSVDEFALGPSLLRPNRPFWVSCVVVMCLQLVLVHVSAVNQFFSCEVEEVEGGECRAMSASSWGPILAISVALFVLVEVEKVLWRPVLQPVLDRIFGAPAPAALPSRAGLATPKPLQNGDDDFKFYSARAHSSDVDTHAVIDSARGTRPRKHSQIAKVVHGDDAVVKTARAKAE